jgi:hypothetical protein
MNDAFPNATWCTCPLHADPWLNQVEISSRSCNAKSSNPKTSRPRSPRTPTARVKNRYNTTAIPFDWRFSRTALHNLLQRVNDTNHRPA